MSSKKNLEQLDLPQLCEEAARIRGVMETAAEDLLEVYTALNSTVRHRLPDDMTFSYISVAGNGRRLAGTVLQVLKRSSSVESRILTRVSQEIEDRTQRKAAFEKRQLEASKKKSQVGARVDPLEAIFGIPGAPPVQEERSIQSDLDDLYGEEV